MAFRSPGEEFAPYLVRAGEAIAGFFRQRDEDRKREEDLLEQTKFQFAQSIQTQLANQFLPQQQRDTLNQQLQMINMAQTQDQLMAMFYGSGPSETTVPGQPMAPLPGGGVSVGPPDVTVTTLDQPGFGRATAEAASASARAQRAYDSTQNQFNVIQQLAATPDIDPAQRQALARNFLGGINPDLLEEGQMSTLMAVTGYQDEPAIRTAINNANLSGAQATSAEVSADIAVNSYDTALAAVVAEQNRTVLDFETATAIAPLEIAQRQADVGLADLRLQTETAIAPLEIAQRQADVALADVRLQEAALNLGIAEELRDSTITRGESAARLSLLNERRAEFDLAMDEALSDDVIAMSGLSREQARIAVEIAQGTMDDVIALRAADRMSAEAAATVAMQSIEAEVRARYGQAENIEQIVAFAKETFQPRVEAVFTDTERSALDLMIANALSESTITEGQSQARRSLIAERSEQLQLDIATELQANVIELSNLDVAQRRVVVETAQRTMEDVIGEVAAGRLSADAAAEVASRSIETELRRRLLEVDNLDAIVQFAQDTLSARIDAEIIATNRDALALDIANQVRDATITIQNATAREADVAAFIAENSVNDVLDQMAAGTITAQAAAEEAAATVDARIRKEFAGADNLEALAAVAQQTVVAAVNTAFAQMESAQSRSRVDVATEQTQIDLLNQQFRINEDTLTRAAETHAQNLELTDVQLQRLRQEIAQSNILFDRELSDDDLNRVQAALDTGVDAFLTQLQREAVAASLGFDISNPQGLQNYNRLMQQRRQQTRAAGEAQLVAAALADDQALLNLRQGEANVEQTRQSIANARQQFEVTSYNFGRSKSLDPLRDAAAFASALNDDVFAGNTGVFDQYINILSNPDLYVEEAEALQDLGYSVDMLRNMRTVAAAERATIITDNQARSDLLAGQVLQLSQANRAQEASIIANVASYYPSVEALDADVSRLLGLRFEPGEIDAIRAQVRLKEVLPPADRLNALTQTPPDPDAYGEWRANFVAVAQETGFPLQEAELLADGFVNAFQSANAESELQNEIDLLNQERLTLEVSRLSAPVPEDSPLALSISEQLSALSGQRLTTQQLQVTYSCMPPETLPEYTVDQILPPDENTCSDLASALENIQTRYSELTGVYNEATSQPFQPTGGSDLSTPDGVLFPSESDGANQPTGPAPTRTVRGGLRFGDVTVPPSDVERMQGIVAMSEEEQNTLLAEFQDEYGIDVTRALLENAINGTVATAGGTPREDVVFSPEEAIAAVRDDSRFQDLLNQTVEVFGTPDAPVENAGVQEFTSRIEETGVPRSEFDRDLATIRSAMSNPSSGANRRAIRAVVNKYRALGVPLPDPANSLTADNDARNFLEYFDLGVTGGGGVDEAEIRSAAQARVDQQAALDELKARLASQYGETAVNAAYQQAANEGLIPGSALPRVSGEGGGGRQ